MHELAEQRKGTLRQGQGLAPFLLEDEPLPPGTDKGLVEKSYYEELQASKSLRVEFQYYVVSEIDYDEIKKQSMKSRAFVLEIENILENLKNEDIEKIRNELNNAIKDLKENKKD